MTRTRIRTANRPLVCGACGDAPRSVERHGSHERCPGSGKCWCGDLGHVPDDYVRSVQSGRCHGILTPDECAVYDDPTDTDSRSAVRAKLADTRERAAAELARRAAADAERAERLRLERRAERQSTRIVRPGSNGSSSDPDTATGRRNSNAYDPTRIPDDPTTVDADTLGVRELRHVASTLGIRAAGLRRDDLVAAVTRAQETR